MAATVMCPEPCQAHAWLIVRRIEIIANGRGADGFINPDNGSARILKASKKIYPAYRLALRSYASRQKIS
jgi:hypothetical protein